MNTGKTFMPFLFSLACLLTGCIHEYPYGASRPNPGTGEDPTSVNAYVDVTFDLNWEEMIHHVDFSSGTRARAERPHRFVIEVTEENEKIYRDVIYISDDEFLSGRLSQRIATPLKSRSYKIAVWYDVQDDESNHHFEADDLSFVKLTNRSTTDSSLLECAFASEELDLSDFNNRQEEAVRKELTLRHAGAKFEIVATDVQQFIINQKEALNQGDAFTSHVEFGTSRHSAFNLYSGSPLHTDESFELSGRMRLPYAEYDELKIAEGYIFCNPEDETDARLTITNTALVPVSQTDYFTFPVKRGFITIIKGDFLTNPIDGIFSVNHIWDGEIILDI